MRKHTVHTAVISIGDVMCGAESSRSSHHSVWGQVSGKEGLHLLLPEQHQNLGFHDSCPVLNKEVDCLVSEHRGYLKKGL